MVQMKQKDPSLVVPAKEKKRKVAGKKNKKN
jgi:hypothetical protein